MARQIVFQLLNTYQEQQVQMLAGFAETALSLHAEPLLARYVSLLPMLPGIHHAAIVSGDGTIAILAPHLELQGRSYSAWRATQGTPMELERVHPVQIGPEVVAQAHLSLSPQFLHQLGRHVSAGALPPFVIFGAIGVLMSLLIGLGLAIYVSRPIHQLVDATRRIADGQFDVPVPVHSSDELGQLAMQFNHMALQLKRLDELKREFLAVVSHDLRSPLGAVASHADHLLSGASGTLTADQTQTLRLIRDQCQRLSHMVSNFLDEARVTAGRLELARQPFDLQAVIEEVCALFAQTAAQQRLSLDVAVPGALPRAWGDRDKTGQILTNLLSNAMKFTPSGGSVLVGARAIPGEPFMEYFIRDTGSGMAEDVRTRLFERFQLSSTAANAPSGARGAGLGLSISKALAEAMGGALRVESTLGQGTTVFVRLPHVPPSGAMRV